MIKLVIAAAILLSCALHADAQIGGTMLALSQRSPATTPTMPMLTGNGHGITFGGQGGTE